MLAGYSLRAPGADAVGEVVGRMPVAAGGTRGHWSGAVCVNAALVAASAHSAVPGLLAAYSAQHVVAERVRRAREAHAVDAHGLGGPLLVVVDAAVGIAQAIVAPDTVIVATRESHFGDGEDRRRSSDSRP